MSVAAIAAPAPGEGSPARATPAPADRDREAVRWIRRRLLWEDRLEALRAAGPAASKARSVPDGIVALRIDSR